MAVIRTQTYAFAGKRSKYCGAIKKEMTMKAIYPKRLTRLESTLALLGTIGDYIVSVRCEKSHDIRTTERVKTRQSQKFVIKPRLARESCEIITNNQKLYAVV